MSESTKISKVKHAVMDLIFPNKNETIDNFLPLVPETPPRIIAQNKTTDGCSGRMSWVWRKMGRVPPWEHCCIDHDYEYHRGGFWYDRKQADLRLWQCVRDSGHRYWAFIIYVAVRFGGAPIWPIPGRWGYGWKYVGRYERRDENDRGDPLDMG